MALECALLSARATGLADVRDLEVGTSSSGGGSGDGSGTASGDGGSGASSSCSAGSSGVGASPDDVAAAERRASHGLAGGGGERACALSAAVFDWHSPPADLRRFDVVLACDVLYEADAVGPISAVVPKLLKSTSGALLLSDPPNRTAANRERFLQLLREGAAPFAIEESYQFRWASGPAGFGRARGLLAPAQHGMRRRCLEPAGAIPVLSWGQCTEACGGNSPGPLLTVCLS
jgi:hypothetical protein